ncbi:unnamed protein product [Clonostachys rhizophaga]|uniref:Protein SYM1 n=1 Tax=Clonostachys rhizophaga TaxID=160324 RepID=A0A9N9V8T5_9HYPO|nr:unnamed protein product [Clonostachys rhizophaga]
MSKAVGILFSRAPIPPSSLPRLFYHCQHIRSRQRPLISHIRRRYCTANNDVKPKKTEDPIPVPNTIPNLPLWQRLGPLTAAASAYGRSQRRRPHTTQLWSCIVIYLISDLSAQGLDGGEYDPARTIRSLLIGGAIAIPSYRWYLFLSRHFNYSSHILSLATKITISQIVYTPLFNTFFFGTQALLSGCTPAEIIERVKYALPTSFINSCKVWPIFTAFSFTFIPMEYRSVFAGVINIGWQTYLAMLNRMAEVETVDEVNHLGSTQVIVMADTE